jgi:hypothetical protein
MCSLPADSLGKNLAGRCLYVRDFRLSARRLSEALHRMQSKRVQSKVRVSLRGLLIDLAPVIFPLSVGPQDTKGDHVVQVVQRPPGAGPLEPALNDVPMALSIAPEPMGRPAAKAPW